MLKALQNLMAMYLVGLSNKRIARRKAIQAALDEATVLSAQVNDLQAAVEQEQAELQTYLTSVTAED